MSTFEKLQASYQRLVSPEKRILRLLSVVYEPVNQTTLNNILSWLYDAEDEFRSPILRVDKQLKNKFEARGLVDITGGRLKCSQAIEGWLTLEAVEQGEFESFLSASLYHVPLLEIHQIYHYPSPIEEKRRLRNALYAGEDETVFELLEIDTPFAEPSFQHASQLLDVCAEPLDANWFMSRSPALQYQILRPILASSVIVWSDVMVFYNLLREVEAGQSALDPAIRALIAEQHLYRAEWQSLEHDLDDIGIRQADVIRACLFFLQGKTAEAVAAFQAFITRSRKETRKRNIVIPGLPGVIYLLALLKHQGDKHQRADNHKAAKLQFKLIDKLKEQDPFYTDMLILDRVRDINDGTRSFDMDFFDANFNYLRPLTTLMVNLALYWNNKTPNDTALTHLRKNASLARSSGYLWLASECDQLLARVEGVEDQQLASSSTQSLLQPPPQFIDVVPVLEEWERSLKALINITVPDKGKPAPDDSQNRQIRLVWQIEDDQYGELTLKAKEQKQKKNGTWTSGRVVALKRLAEEPDNFSYLTEADTQICRFIRHEKNYDYYGYSKHTYSLVGISALLAARGHPHLFHADNPDQSVEILTGTPQLLVVEQGNQICLTLEPHTFGNDSLIIKETPARIRIYQYSAALLHIAQILGVEGLLVPETARDKVLESVSAIAPLLTIHSDVAGITDSQAQRVEADNRIYVHLQPLDSDLRLSFHVQPFSQGPTLPPGRGGISIFAEIDGKQLQTTRDLEKENKNLATIQGACQNLYEVEPNDWRWADTEDALEGLLSLQSLEDIAVLNWPEGKRIKLSRTISVNDMSISLRQKTDWFEISGELRVDTERVFSMQALLELVNAAGSSRFIKLAEGEFLALTGELRQRLVELGSYNDKGKVHSLNAINLEESIDGMSVDADAAWGQFMQRLQAAKDLQPELPSTLQADLRDYQLLGFNWLSRLSAWGAGACLADDMGLGKTLQALALIVNRAVDGPTLVLAPTSVCTNWIDEARKFAPTLNPIRFGAGDRKKMLDELKPFDLLICSYGLLQSEAELIQALHWQTIVADEAQAFKNSATKRSRAMMKLDGDFKMITTGTPIENHLGELWNLFQFINPGLLASREVFNKKFANPIENQNDASAAQALRKLISPFILRRLKSNVLTELPPRTDITLRVDLSKEESALYEALRLEAVNQLKDTDLKPNQQRIRALASITRLRRAVCNPNIVMPDANLPSAKLDMFSEVLQELLENKHKALVFSQFVDHLSLIRAHLDKLGVAYQYLDGSTSTAKRTKAINAFQAGQGDVFLISLKAGGVGLNLTAADYVIHMDPWWNPAVEDQASDRAHRIGQQRPVTVYRIIANNTIEEKIVDLHAQKRDLADSLLEGAEISARMSLNDMLALIDT